LKPDKVFRNKYILASKSPRRIKLLKQIGLDFKSFDAEVEEKNHHKNPLETVRYNSRSKASKALKMFPEQIIIAADTIVVINNKVLNKPSGAKEAEKFLKILSNKKHTVYTGIFVINGKKETRLFECEKTDVYFRKLNNDEISFYVKNHKPLDKAGSYGIQDDYGCLFVKKIAGDYYNVVGLPLTRLYLMLKKII
jgi:septum formation protein